METIYSNQIPSPLIYLEKYMNRLLFGFLFLASMYLPLSAQTHNSVPLDDPIYFLLETASIKGYCTLPAIRPYSQKTILKALEQIAASDDASPLERDSAQAAILRLQPPSQEAWYKTGRLNFNYDTASGLKNRLGLGVNLSAHIGSNFTKPSFTWEAILDAWVNGDFTKYFSYKLLMAAGLSHYDFDAYPPYTFSQPYDGFQFLLNPMGDFTAKSQDGHIGMKIQPELSFGFRWHAEHQLLPNQEGLAAGSGSRRIAAGRFGPPLHGSGHLLFSHKMAATGLSQRCTGIQPSRLRHHPSL